MNGPTTSSSPVASSSNTCYKEPYKATRVWLESVALFRQGVPLGKHRKQFKSYEDTFVANEAITWFQTKLREKFEQPTITRQQTLRLLQKFYKSGIFTNVSKKCANDFEYELLHTRETDFKDNGRLYRLVYGPGQFGFSKPKATDNVQLCSPRSPLQSHLQVQSSSSARASTMEYDSNIRSVPAEKVEDVWKDIFLKRFVQVVGCDVTHTFQDVSVVRGHFILQNFKQQVKSQNSGNGKRSDIDSHGEDATTATNLLSTPPPAWLLSAMKCLASWPNHQGKNEILTHVNYPGFENDVFKLITEYYQTFRGIPLLTYELYDVFVTTFIRAELFDFNSRLYNSKTSNNRIFQQFQVNMPTQMRVESIPPASSTDDYYPFSASDSLGNLLFDMLTPKTITTAQTRAGSRQAIVGCAQTIVPVPGNNSTPKSANSQTGTGLFGCSPFFGGKEGKSIAKRMLPFTTDKPATAEKKKDKSPKIIFPLREPSEVVDVPDPMSPKEYDVTRYRLQNPFYYETAFTGVESPVTRVVSQTELKSSFATLPSRPRKQMPLSRVRVGALSSPAAYAYENPSLELSASDIINHPKYSDIRTASTLIGSSTDRNAEATYSFCDYSTLTTTNISANSSRSASSSGYGTSNRSASAFDLSDSSKDRALYLPWPTRQYSNVSTGNVQAFLVDEKKRENAITENGYKKLNSSSPTDKENVTRNILSDYSNMISSYAGSPSKSARRTLDFYYGADACVPGLMTAEGKKLAVVSFRLLTMLLPPTNRLHLKLLLRCMSKMSQNDKLMLDVAVTTRALVVNTFFRTILRSFEDSEFDELLALRIVTFFMDNDKEIFNLHEDEGLQAAVDSTLSELIQIAEAPANSPRNVTGPGAIKKGNLGRSKSSPTNAKPTVSPSKIPLVNKKCSKPNVSAPVDQDQENKENVQYCSRISLDEFEGQRLLAPGGTAEQLRQLLEQIFNAPMDEKEKRRQLKNFQKTYPHIFFEKFGQNEMTIDLLNETVKSQESENQKSKKGHKPFGLLRAFNFKS